MLLNSLRDWVKGSDAGGLLSVWFCEWSSQSTWSTNPGYI